MANTESEKIGAPAKNAGPPAFPSFSTKRATEKVCIDGKQYTLTELVGDELDDIKDEVTIRVRLVNGTPTRMPSQKGIAAMMISRCLTDPDGKKVPEETVAKWPASLVTFLEDRCNKLNRRTDEAQEEAKNS